MKKISTLLVLLGFAFISAGMISCKKDDPVDPGDGDGGDGGGTTDLTTLSEGSQTFSGNLSTGAKLSDLSWAWDSGMACFVEPVKNQYKGNHVFYKINLPDHSTIDIYLRPSNASHEMSLYGYSKGAGSSELPPSISSCVSCESSPSANGLPTTGEQHIYLNAVTNPYSIILGVAGADALTSGAYEIEIVVES